MTRIFLTLIYLMLLFTSSALAHPEDELCGRDSYIDPAICEELAAMDRPAFAFTQDAAPTTPYTKVATLYFRIGLDHVFPNGWDHILFVFAIILSARRILSAIGLVSIFTLAHALAILFASMGFVSWEGPWLEVMIAATIFWAGLECIFMTQPPPWRGAVVFGFGLIHGLGLAGAITAQGLPEGQFFTAFFAFNIGIEVAQLGCALVGLAIIRLINRIRPIPTHKIGGGLVALFGLIWTVERMWGAFQ